MKKIAARALLVSISAVFCLHFGPLQASEAPPLAGASLTGQGSLRFLGFEIYQARLWTAAGFDPADYGAHPLALELTYQRDFTSEAIAKRSLEEMRRVGRFSDQQGQRWLRALQAALPDVKAGDRLTGIYQPGVGAVFRMGSRVVGEVADPEFARLFFGIWLSPQTSEPGLRQSLIASRTPTRPSERP